MNPEENIIENNSKKASLFGKYICTGTIKKVLVIGMSILFVITCAIVGSAYLTKKTEKNTNTNQLGKIKSEQGSIKTIIPSIAKTIIPTEKPLPTVTSFPTNFPTSVPTATNVPVPTNTPIPLYTPTPTPLPPDTSPPIITDMGGPGNNTTVNFNGFCFPFRVSDNQSQIPHFWTQYQFDSSTWTEWNNTNDVFSPCFQNIQNGQHSFSVHVKDGAGNVSETITRMFTVQI